MKTSIKILLLIFFSIGAIAGVLVFAKTQVAPPSEIEITDQYVQTLANNSDSLRSISNFDDLRNAYIKSADKISRFYKEHAISATNADANHQSIAETYGNALINYGFGIFRKSVWPKDDLNNLQLYLTELSSERLTSGRSVVSNGFTAKADKIRSIIKSYDAAWSHSKKNGFNSVDDAREKIQKARNYASADYLRNNTELVNTLNAMPAKIERSHYAYVSNCVNDLNKYTSVSREHFVNTLGQKAQTAIDEYKSAEFYGNNKREIQALEERLLELVNAAANYYN